MIRVLGCLQLYGCDVRQIRPNRLLVDRTLVHAGVATLRAVDSVDMDDRERLKEDLGFGLDEATPASVPASAL